MNLKCHSSKNAISDLSKTISFLKVIGEENRLKILCLLKEKQQCVCDVWQFLELSQNLVSHHLKVLKDFGLVSSKKEGLKVSYTVNEEVLNKHLKLLENYLKS